MLSCSGKCGGEMYVAVVECTLWTLLHLRTEAEPRPKCLNGLPLSMHVCLDSWKQFSHKTSTPACRGRNCTGENRGSETLPFATHLHACNTPQLCSQRPAVLPGDLLWCGSSHRFKNGEAQCMARQELKGEYHGETLYGTLKETADTLQKCPKHYPRPRHICLDSQRRKCVQHSGPAVGKFTEVDAEGVTPYPLLHTCTPAAPHSCVHNGQRGSCVTCAWVETDTASTKVRLNRAQTKAETYKWRGHLVRHIKASCCHAPKLSQKFGILDLCLLAHLEGKMRSAFLAA